MAQKRVSVGSAGSAMLHPDRMRSTLAALLGVACWLVAQVARAGPLPAVQSAAGSGSAYVGTVNPNASPPLTLPAIDMGPVNVTTTNNQDGSVDINLQGGIFDVVHFGVGQAFTGSAGVDAFMHAEVGSIHLAASGAAQTTPFAYEAPFPGALGQNPFYAQAIVNIGAEFVDVVTVPATAAAPNPGDLTPVQLEVLATCSLSVSDGSSDFTGFISANLSLADGTNLGGVLTMDPVIFSPEDPVCPFGAMNVQPINVPVLTPIVLTFDFSAELTLTAGHDLFGVYRQGLLSPAHSGDFPTDQAAIDALNTGEVMLTNSEGKGAIGSTGHDYTTLNGGPTITTTTTTTTTSTFVPPTTLPGCTGYCGDGVVQPDCAETCECPMVGGMTVAVCDATTSTPSLEPACARCAGCMVDLSQCGTTTTSTSTTEPGQTTTTSTTPGGTGTTTSTTVPCQTIRCRLDDGIHASACAGETIPAPITKDFDRVTSLVAEAGGASPKRAKRLIKHAEHALTQAENAAKKATKGKKPKLTVDCAGAIHQAAEEVRSSLPK
jgi:hypothetical protein